MKIIHLVLGKANPERMNGVNKVAYYLASRQAAAGYDVAVWGLTQQPVHDYPARNFETRLFQRRALGLPLGLQDALSQLPQDTILQLHGVFIPVLDRVARLLVKLGLPYIVTPHGSFSKAAMGQRGWIKSLYFRWVGLPSLRAAKQVQSLGEQESSDLYELAPEVRQVLIPNGQDLAEIPHLPKRRSGNEPVFGFCGRLDAFHKGLDLLLEAVNLCRQQGTRINLVLIGDGKDRPKLQAYCQEHGLEQQVTFLGAQYGYDKYGSLAQCDYFMHTSRMEGFPVAVLEAAALGLPCLTTPPTSFNRYLHDYQAGLPIPEVSVAAIAAAMQQAVELFDKPIFVQMQANARQMITDAFDWDHIAAQLVKAYQR